MWSSPQEAWRPAMARPWALPRSELARYQNVHKALCGMIRASTLFIDCMEFTYLWLQIYMDLINCFLMTVL